MNRDLRGHTIMQAPISNDANKVITPATRAPILDSHRLARIYKGNQKAAIVTTLTIAILLVFALTAFWVDILEFKHLVGIILCGLLLIGLNVPRLWAIKKWIRTWESYYTLSLASDILGIFTFTAIMYLLGGTDASFLTLLYAVLVCYVGVMAPKKFSFLLAGICALAFLSMVALETFGILSHQCVLATAPPLPQHQLIISIGVTVLLFLAAYVSAFTAQVFKSIKESLQKKNAALERTMKEMAAAKQELRKAQDELEKRVQERTAQLSRLTDHLQAEILVREKAERELRQSEESYRRIFENSIAGFFQSTPDGRFLKVNQAFARILGYDSPKDVISSITDISTQYYANPKDRKRYEAELAQKGHLENFETRVIRKDGSIIWVSSCTRGYFDDSGKPSRYDGVIIDITERKQAEEEREKLQEQLIQAQKMESVGRLAGGVAHDFNNMLGVIMGHTELMLMKATPESSFYNGLMEIRNAAQRSSDLTRQLLAFARKQAIRPKVLDLNETTEGMLKMLRTLIGEEITLAWKPQSQLWLVNIDPSQLDQILANLCVNARDAIGGIGTITIETKNVTLDESFCHVHRGAKPGEYVMLAVSDDGCGMPKDIMEKIFDPFFSTKEPGKGTGLGLSTVYGIVKQNHGYIDVYSDPGNGTTFRIYFPRHIGQRESQQHTEEQLPQTSNGETVLVAEDEPLVLNTIRDALVQLGYKVFSAVDPNEALRWAQRYSGEIHLLITDIVMPHMDGKELAEHISSLRPNTKILYMSGYTQDAIVQNGIVEEDVHFIQKPFTPAELARMVRNILKGQDNGPSKEYQASTTFC